MAGQRKGIARRDGAARRTKLFAWLWLSKLGLSWLFCASPSWAQGRSPKQDETEKVKPNEFSVLVVGKLSLDSKTDALADGFRVSGTITDENSLGVANVKLKALDGLLVDCDGSSRSIVSRSRGEYCFQTNKSGALQLRLEHPLYETLDTKFVLRAASDPSPRMVRSPPLVDLVGSGQVTLEVLIPKDAQTATDSQLWIGLGCPSGGDFIAHQTAHAGEVARFEVPYSAFPWVGYCTLTPVLGRGNGKPSIGLLSQAPPGSAKLELRAPVALALRESSCDDLGCRVALSVTAQGRPVSSGIIELRMAKDRNFVGSASVERGAMKIQLLDIAPSTPLVADFLGNDPFLLRPTSLPIALPARAGVSLRTGVQGAILFCISVWLVLLWQNRRRAPALPTELAPPGEARVDAIGKREGPLSGRVLDAHTGEAIAQAEVSVLRVSLESEERIAHTTTDGEGHFLLALEGEADRILRVVVKGPLHESLRTEVRNRQLTVHLTTRRRAALLLLLEPFREFRRKRRAPTPAELAQSSREKGLKREAHWAQAVETATYGSEAPSESRVAELARERPEPVPEPTPSQSR